MADAISSVLGFETMILDHQLRIVAGTGRYTELCGSFESEAFVPEEYLYKYILRIGGTYVVDDITDPLYGPEELDTYGETGEICCAIPGKTGNVGIIALVSFDDEDLTKEYSEQFSKNGADEDFWQGQDALMMHEHNDRLDYLAYMNSRIGG